MGKHVYRGTSLSDANEMEFESGRIEGETVNIYRGRLDTDTPNATVARGTPVDELPWWDDGGRVDDPVWEDSQGVTGGLTSTIGTAIGFGDGIPVVLFLNERELNGSPTPIRYAKRWFDGYEAALPWVYGPSVDGEIRTEDEGLIGLTTSTDTGPQVWVWGDEGIERNAMQYENERESLVMADHIGIGGAVESVATFLESQRTPKQALATFGGYTTTPRFEDGEDISDWSSRETARALHQAVEDAAETQLDDYWVIVLNSVIMDDIDRIPDDAFVFAYNGRKMVDTSGEMPPHLLGR